MSRLFVRTPPLLSVIRFIKSIARLLRALFARHPDWMCLLGRPRLLRHRRRCRRLQDSLQCRFRGLSVRPLLALNRCAFNFDCLQIRLSYRTHRFRYCVIINIFLLCLIAFSQNRNCDICIIIILVTIKLLNVIIYCADTFIPSYIISVSYICMLPVSLKTRCHYTIP